MSRSPSACGQADARPPRRPQSLPDSARSWTSTASAGSAGGTGARQACAGQGHCITTAAADEACVGQAVILACVGALDIRPLPVG